MQDFISSLKHRNFTQSVQSMNIDIKIWMIRNVNSLIVNVTWLISSIFNINQHDAHRHMIKLIYAYEIEDE